MEECTERYIYKGQKKLRLGYTTGTCAAAAAKAASLMVLGGKRIESVELATPKGMTLTLPIADVDMGEGKVSCAVIKDAGDDYDVTDGAYIYVCVEKTGHGFEIQGGEGVGTVTKPGLDQSVGSAAINSVPRRMIMDAMLEAADDHGYEGGLRATVFVPQGADIAKKTLNEKLGIVGGISILGTSGIVEPMSEEALKGTIRAELSIRSAEGKKDVIITPGNYGATFLEETLKADMEHTVKCSNFIGDTIDMACEFGLDSLLLVGHLGKLVKLGSGIMNTHSAYADGRMETMASCVLLADGDLELARRMLFCNTTDEAVGLLMQADMLTAVMERLMARIDAALKRRAGEGLRIEAIVFSNQYGLLGETKGAGELLLRHRRQNGFAVD